MKDGEKGNLNIEKFEDFNVYTDENGYAFIYVDFYDKDKVISGLINYLFDEDNLLEYTNNITKLKLDEDNPRYWARLYNNISIFLNDSMEKCKLDKESQQLIDVIGEEYHLINENGELLVQKDKVGKIGEYAFHVLLSQYYKLNCILPKFRCTTDRNMSVFGIDTLFLDLEKRIIYFGESKFSKNIDNGIVLANRSLKEYEQQIREEYRIVLTSIDAFALSSDFLNLFNDELQICITFDKFIELSKITDIGVPIFIAHGKKDDRDTPEIYIEKLKNKIDKVSFFGLKTNYILISFPVIDKAEFVEKAIKKVVEKQHEFEQRCR